MKVLCLIVGGNGTNTPGKIKKDYKINTINRTKEETVILEFLAKDGSWKNLYFKKFSIVQKILFFIPILFLVFPILGTYLLFFNHSWLLFVSAAILGIFSIWLFFKQKSNYEHKTFDKHYRSTNCNKMSD